MSDKLKKHIIKKKETVKEKEIKEEKRDRAVINIVISLVIFGITGLIIAYTLKNKYTISEIQLDGVTYTKDRDENDLNIYNGMINTEYNKLQLTVRDLLSNSVMSYARINSNGDVIQSQGSIYSVYYDDKKYMFTSSGISESTDVNYFDILNNLKRLNIKQKDFYKSDNGDFIMLYDFNKSFINTLYNNNIDDDYEENIYKIICKQIGVDENSGTRVVVQLLKNEYNEYKYGLYIKLIQDEKINTLFGISSSSYKEEDFNIDNIKNSIAVDSDSMVLNSCITTIKKNLGL